MMKPPYHEVKVAGEVMEVEWQKSLNEIASGKGERFIQIDFPLHLTLREAVRKGQALFYIIVDLSKTAIQRTC